ncbi:MAG TPA: GNAT family N-acetyltransferase [Candidatus Limnocylindrales bacterium]|nr:GNAT family N-acetyltransferase [Candidatus Limnocylindrales bacterium]
MPRSERTVAGGVVVEPMAPEDRGAVLDIFAQGIATGVATFETVTPDWSQWDAEHRPDCRLVARLDGRVVGWTALSSYSRRAVYAGVAWESVYVDAAVWGRGVARALLAALVPASEDAGIWTLLAGVQAENTASLALHERAGFRRIGVQERVGRDAAGIWRDVVLLERRRPAVGA